MPMSRPVCWVSAITTPTSASTGASGHSGIRDGRVASRSRTRLTNAAIATRPYNTMISTAVNVTVVTSFYFQPEDGIRPGTVTGVQTCALPIFRARREAAGEPGTAHQRGADGDLRARYTAAAAPAARGGRRHRAAAPRGDRDHLDPLPCGEDRKSVV